MHAPHAAQLEPAEGNARVLEDEALDVRDAEAIGGHRGRVLGAEDDEELALGHVPADIRAQGGRDVGHVVENACRGGRDVVVDVVGRLAAEEGDHALLGLEAQAHVQRRPRRGVLALRDGEGELGGAALRGHVVTPRPAPAHVHQDEPEGAPDRRVGAEAGAEEPRARMHPDGARDGATDHEERSHGMGGGLHAVEIEGRLEQGAHRRHDDGKVRGVTAGHDGIDGELPHARLPPERRHDAEHPRGIGSPEHGAHALRRGRNDGQPIAPVALDELRVDLVLGDLEIANRGNGIGHGGLLSRVLTAQRDSVPLLKRRSVSRNSALPGSRAEARSR